MAIEWEDGNKNQGTAFMGLVSVTIRRIEKPDGKAHYIYTLGGQDRPGKHFFRHSIESWATPELAKAHADEYMRYVAQQFMGVKND